MEQLIQNMDVVIAERHDFTMQMKHANKQKKQKVDYTARVESNALSREMGDDLLQEMEEEDHVLDQVEGNEQDYLQSHLMNSRVEPLVGYCAMKDFCGRLKSVRTNDEKILAQEW